jgi:hypothetical protein
MQSKTMHSKPSRREGEELGSNILHVDERNTAHLSAWRKLSEGRIRRSRTRAINGVDHNVSLNRALWTLAEGLQRLKGR